MGTRTLSLKREALTALTEPELAAFGGAGDTQPTPPNYAPTTPVRDCLTAAEPTRLVCPGPTWEC